MSVKAEKPTLTGARIKTRKRDEKEKYDPNGFRDSVIQGLNESANDLEQLSAFLDRAGSKLNYRRYAETLFDCLFAGGILAPGGTLLEDAEPDKPWRADMCVFSAKANVEILKGYYEVFYKLIRRYKYLEKSFEDELKKLILFLKGFNEEERRTLGRITGIFLANGLGDATVLSSLFEDHLVKEGLSLEFAIELFDMWLKEKDIGHISSTLKRAKLEDSLMLLLPLHKRTQENFENHFKAAGLESIIDFQRSKANIMVKKKLKKHLEEMMKEEAPVKEIVAHTKEQIKENSISEHEAVVMVWNVLMSAVEWNKKADLVADQSLKHLRTYTPLLASLTTSGRSELALIVKVQDYCYDNMNFMKAFQKIILLFYKTEVLSEDVILKWYKDAHSTKGKSVFLEQMKKFVEWLQNAEEESEEEDGDDD